MGKPIFYGLKSLVKHMFRLFFRLLHMHCQVEFSKMHAICWPAILEVRRNHNMFLYFHALLPYFSQSG